LRATGPRRVVAEVHIGECADLRCDHHVGLTQIFAPEVTRRNRKRLHRDVDGVVQDRILGSPIGRRS